MEELSKKTLPELRDMAKALNIKSVTKYKKNDLIELIKDNSNDNKEDNTAKDSDEYVKKQNIKAEQQKIEKEKYLFILYEFNKIIISLLNIMVNT